METLPVRYLTISSQTGLDLCTEMNWISISVQSEGHGESSGPFRRGRNVLANLYKLRKASHHSQQRVILRILSTGLLNGSDLLLWFVHSPDIPRDCYVGPCRRTAFIKRQVGSLMPLSCQAFLVQLFTFRSLVTLVCKKEALVLKSLIYHPSSFVSCSSGSRPSPNNSSTSNQPRH